MSERLEQRYTQKQAQQDARRIYLQEFSGELATLMVSDEKCGRDILLFLLCRFVWIGRGGRCFIWQRLPSIQKILCKISG